MDKADPKIMEYVVIVLRACSGTRKQVLRKMIDLLWSDISHGTL